MSVDTFVKNPWSFPDSKLVLRADAPKEEWLDGRTHGIGGSDVSKLLNISKWGSAYGVWLDKTGRGTDLKMNEALYWGKAMEPILRQRFVEDTGIAVRSAGLHRSKHHPFMQVTLDGVTADGGIFESKTTSGWLSDEWSDGQVADHAELQVQHGMAVTGRSHAWVVALIDGRDWRVRRVERDEKLIDMIIAEEERFWLEHVLADVAPPVTHVSLDEVKTQYGHTDPDAPTVDVDPKLAADIAARIKAGKQAEKDAIADWKLAEAELRVLAGPAELLTVGGKPFGNLRNNGTFSSTRFRDEQAELAEALTIQVPGLDMVTLKKDHADIYNQYRARVLRLAAEPKK